jgi:hypothetical protein
MTFAEPAEDASANVDDGTGPVPITMGVPQLDGLLFIGTSRNSSDPTNTLNDVFTVDPVSDSAVSVLTGVQTWGATADPANSRVLFTRSSGTASGDELFEVPYAGGTPTSVGIITMGGSGFRIDGLAISGGVLYGSYAGGSLNGLYEIDWGTLEATLVGSYSDSISGIDADPDTGIIYGVNDTIGAIVTIDTAGVTTFLDFYPAGLGDIDGIAVGGGIAYLVTDEAGDIPVYDLAAGSYGTPLTSPFTAADTFSAAAIAVGGGGTDDGGSDDGGVPATTGIGLALLVILLGGGGAYFLRRK